MTLFVHNHSVYFEAAREVSLGEADTNVAAARPRLRAAAPGLRIAVLGGVSRRFKRSFAKSHAMDIESIEPDFEVKAFRRELKGEVQDTDTDTDNGNVRPDTGNGSSDTVQLLDVDTGGAKAVIKQAESGTNVASAPRPVANRSFRQAPRPRVSCDLLSQTRLSPKQWNLDRLVGSGIGGVSVSLLDGKFTAPECLCGRYVLAVSQIQTLFAHTRLTLLFHTRRGVSVFVIDTGARTTHAEFAGRVGQSVNFVECSGDGSGAMKDDSGHGTHVSGTVLGTTSGVAKCASLHPVRVLDGNGQGKSSSIVEALDWIAELVLQNGNRKIVSMSLGTYFPITTFRLPLIAHTPTDTFGFYFSGGPRSSALDAAVREMVNAGIPVICAAGNEQADASTTSPAGEASVITVGSTSCYETSQKKKCVSDDVSVFSNFGTAVDVYAPGDDVRSAWIDTDYAWKQNRYGRNRLSQIQARRLPPRS